MKKYYSAILCMGFLFAGMAAEGYATPVITDGLVAAYEFSGNSADSSGNGYDAVNHGAVLTTDRFGVADNAYSFDGTSSSYLSVDSFASSSSYTLMGWVSWDNSVDGWRPFIDNYPASSNVRFEIRDNRLSLSDKFSASLGTLTTDTWYHMAVAYDAGLISFYFDGQAVGTVSSTMGAFASSFEMGRGLYGGDEYLSGSMDDVYIFNRALSAAEIEVLYSADPVPEPSTMVLLAAGILGVTGLRTLKQKG